MKGEKSERDMLNRVGIVGMCLVIVFMIPVSIMVNELGIPIWLVIILLIITSLSILTYKSIFVNLVLTNKNVYIRKENKEIERISLVDIDKINIDDEDYDDYHITILANDKHYNIPHLTTKSAKQIVYNFKKIKNEKVEYLSD